MRHLSILLLTLAALNTYAQDNAGFKRIQLGINVSTDLCYRMLENNDGSADSDLVIEVNDENETIKEGYTAGLNVVFNLSQSIGLETGMQYSNKGYQTKYQNLIFPIPDPNIPEKSKSVYNFQYIDVPLKVNFTLGQQQVRFFTSLGVTANIFLKASSTAVLVYSDHRERETTPDDRDYNRLNISPTISVGVDYKINDSSSLRIEPTFRYGVMKIIDAPVTGYLYSAGLNIGYYFGS